MARAIDLHVVGRDCEINLGPSFHFYFAIGDPECNRRFRRHGWDIQHASMLTPDEIRKAKLHVRHAGMPAPEEIKAKLLFWHARIWAPDDFYMTGLTSGMPGCRHRTRFT